MEKLVDNKVVARFDGGMEFGPRALGNRSILYPALEPVDARVEAVDPAAEFSKQQRLLAHRLVDGTARALCFDECLAGVPGVPADARKPPLELPVELPSQHPFEQPHLFTCGFRLRHIRHERG